MEFYASSKTDEPITTAQLVAVIEKFCTYATELAQRIRKAAKEGLVVPSELDNIPAATVKLVGFLRNLKPAAAYFKPEFVEALYFRVLGMQRDYQGLSHNVDIWLSGQRAKVVRFKPTSPGSRYSDDDRESSPYLISMVGARSLL